MSTVYLVNGNDQYREMFRSMGWKITNSLRLANLIQFTGGSDISPILYGQQMHPLTSAFIMRDRREQYIFNVAKKHKIPMAGICRGGQFLNVMNGGSMWQHCDGHALSTSHKAVDAMSGEAFDVTSTHHQIMEPNSLLDDMLVVLEAKEGTFREKMPDANSFASQKISAIKHKSVNDVEAVWYESSRSFCFQPHPEFQSAGKELKERYFGYIATYLEP